MAKDQAFRTCSLSLVGCETHSSSSSLRQHPPPHQDPPPPTLIPLPGAALDLCLRGPKLCPDFTVAAEEYGRQGSCLSVLYISGSPFHCVASLKQLTGFLMPVPWSVEGISTEGCDGNAQTMHRLMQHTTVICGIIVELDSSEP